MYFDPDRHQRVQKYVSGDTAVLFVHGIQGSPCQFRFMTDALDADISFDNMILPGHGSDTHAFRRANMEDWQNAVNLAASALNARFRKTYYVGHSMGCLLGLRALLGGSARFDGMLLIACPLKIHFTLKYLKRNHLSLIKKDSSDPYLLAAQEANSVSARSAASYAACLHPYAELLKLMSKTNKELAELPCAVSAFHSDDDEIVAAQSLERLKNAGANTFVLPECSHNYFSAQGKAQLIQALRDMTASNEN